MANCGQFSMQIFQNLFLSKLLTLQLEELGALWKKLSLPRQNGNIFINRKGEIYNFLHSFYNFDRKVEILTL